MTETMHDGRPCPEFIQRMMSKPGVLRARAEIRRVIAAQDLLWHDSWAMHRNLNEAQRLEEAARATEGQNGG